MRRAPRLEAQLCSGAAAPCAASHSDLLEGCRIRNSYLGWARARTLVNGMHHPARRRHICPPHASLGALKKLVNVDSGMSLDGLIGKGREEEVRQQAGQQQQQARWQQAGARTNARCKCSRPGPPAHRQAVCAPLAGVSQQRGERAMLVERHHVAVQGLRQGSGVEDRQAAWALPACSTQAPEGCHNAGRLYSSCRCHASNAASHQVVWALHAAEDAADVWRGGLVPRAAQDVQHVDLQQQHRKGGQWERRAVGQLAPVLLH